MKFTVTIQELISAYATKKQSDDDYLCHFIQYHLLPNKSFPHKLYFTLFVHTSSTEFIHQVAHEFNCIPRHTLENMLHNHPNFKDITAYQLNTYDYRLQILHRMKELKPNLKFTFNF